MEFFIRLNNQPCSLIIPVKAENAFIQITGEDSSRPYTKYFDRYLGTIRLFSGTKFFQFPLPLSPQILKIKISNKVSDDSTFKVFKPEIKNLQSKDLWQSKRTRKFMQFAIEFCEKAGFLEPGVYSSQDNEFHIIFTNDIRDKHSGKIMFTPARVSRISGLMEVSRRKFLGYTIPMRLLILLHENMHYECNTRSEIEADLNALRIYLASGFPATEAIYATANIFHDSQEMVERVNQIMNFIKDFDRDEQIHPSHWRASA